MLPKEENRRFYELALSFVPDVGPKTARALLARYHSVEEIFKAPLKELTAISHITEQRAKGFGDKEVFQRAELELELAAKNGVEILFLTDEKYPKRFLHCEDPAVVLYYKGTADLNAQKVVAVIGTRKHTDYGQRATEDLIEGLRGFDDLLVVSGLALGIDTIAHRASVRNGLHTVGVMGNGLEQVYPFSNRSLAHEMLQRGGLLTEFPFGTKPDRQNFPVRNRVVAGMSDITVVVESDVKGGAMITAYLAHSYNREVAAFPGRVYDGKSGGPNLLLKRNIAVLINDASDLLEHMNWSKQEQQKAVQKQLFMALTPDEQLLYDLLKNAEMMHADELLIRSGLDSSQLASVLLQMEMQGFVKTLPGKQYRIN